MRIGLDLPPKHDIQNLKVFKGTNDPYSHLNTKVYYKQLSTQIRTLCDESLK